MQRGFVVLAALATLAAIAPAHGQGAVDPVGRITQATRHPGGKGVLVGRDVRGGSVCFKREEGDTHRLDIGIGDMGAFVRLETPEPRDATPQAPLRVYAGLQETEGERYTGRFRALLVYEGEVAYAVPDRTLAGFVLVASDPANFLPVVAAARENFLVVEQRRSAVRDYVAVYEFDRAAVQAVMACRQKQRS